jgi:integrase
VLAEADLARLRKYVVLPVIAAMLLTAVRPKHARDIVRQLRAAGELAPRTIIGLFRTLRTMFESAVVDELVEANPIKAKPGELPKQRDQDPTWRSQATFTVGEVERLISDPAIPVERRVQYALKALAGMRHGEVAALTWRAIDYTAEPLARIHMVRAYNSATGQLKTTKTEDGHAVPMHPTLAKIIATWRLSHWSRLYGRQPTPDDLGADPQLDAGRLGGRGARVQGRPGGARAAHRGGCAPRSRWARPARLVQDPLHRGWRRLADHPAHHPRTAARRERRLRAVHVGDDLPRGEQAARRHPRR